MFLSDHHIYKDWTAHQSTFGSWQKDELLFLKFSKIQKNNFFYFEVILGDLVLTDGCAVQGEVSGSM